MIIWTPDDFAATVADAAKVVAAQERRERLLDWLGVALLLAVCAGLGFAVAYLALRGAA